MNVADSLGFAERFRKFENSAAAELGDFTTTRRVLRISLLAVIIGLASAVIAFLLLRLIAFFTNLFFFQTLSFSGDTTPALSTLGVFIVIVPVIGGLIVGLMARYGSDRIRGHGIPEAIEAILLNGSKVQPKIALLKPLSSAPPRSHEPPGARCRSRSPTLSASIATVTASANWSAVTSTYCSATNPRSSLCMRATI